MAEWAAGFNSMIWYQFCGTCNKHQGTCFVPQLGINLLELQYPVNQTAFTQKTFIMKTKKSHVLTRSVPCLTHLPPNKMAAISQMIFQMHFHEWKFLYYIQMSLKFVPRCQIDNKSVLVQVMAWRRTGDKPLPEPMLTQFTDAYMRH